MIRYFDTETCLIERGMAAPPLVCMATEDQLYDRDQATEVFESWLDEGAIIAGHNVSYDMLVMLQRSPHLLNKIWKAYDDDQVLCTQKAAELHSIAAGTFTVDREKGAFKLDRLGKKYFGEGKRDEDEWRLRYSELIDIPIHLWPETARTYPMFDVELTARLGEVLFAHNPLVSREEIVRQTRADWWRLLVTARGLRTDLAAVRKLQGELAVELADLSEDLVHLKIFRDCTCRKPKFTPTGEKIHNLTCGRGKRDMTRIKALVVEAYEGRPPMTDPSEKYPEGQVSTSGDTLKESGNPELTVLSERMSVEKLLTGFIEKLLQDDVGQPFSVVNPSYGLVETGRSSSWGPNIQNQPRKGGVRECFVPRDGMVFVGGDWSAIELAALAEVLLDWFGYSCLADTLRAGKDPHTNTACDIVGMPYEQLIEHVKAEEPWAVDARQMAKSANFGLAGGLGVKTFMQYARATYGVILTEEQAKRAKEAFFSAYPEMRTYFSRINEMCEVEYLEDGTKSTVPFAMRQPKSGRLRGGLRFTSAANTNFQGLVADGAMDTGYRLVKETHLGRLRGSYVVAFIHDEFILETPQDQAEKTLAILKEIMIDQMSKWITQVPIKVGTKVIGDRWHK